MAKFIEVEIFTGEKNEKITINLTQVVSVSPAEENRTKVVMNHFYAKSFEKHNLSKSYLVTMKYDQFLEFSQILSLS